MTDKKIIAEMARRQVLPVFTLADVAEMVGGVSKRTISRYLYSSRTGGRYADRPFPEPDGRVGGSPIWLLSRFDELQEWHLGRKGRGVDGGKPSHKASGA